MDGIKILRVKREEEWKGLRSSAQGHEKGTQKLGRAEMMPSDTP